MSEDHLCPSYAVAVGYFAVASAVVFSNFGSAWGTWRAGVTILHSGIRHPEGVMKNIIPIVMAGVIGIYGLIVAVILGQSIDTPDNNRYNTYSTYTAMAHLAAGLCCGLSGLAAGGTIGIIGDYGIRSIGYRITKVSLFESTSPNALDGPTRPSNNTQETSGLLAAEDFDFEADDQNKLFVSMLIMLIFSEALALYESKVNKIISLNQCHEWMQYNQTHMSRVYPGGIRLDSSNYNPVSAWSTGCQLVALNFQTPDAALRANDGRYRENANCGYVLKPEELLHQDFTISHTFDVPLLRMMIRVLSGSCLPKPKGDRKGECIDPYVQVTLNDLTDTNDMKMKTYYTTSVSSNGFFPIWNSEEFRFSVRNQSVAILQFTVWDKDVGSKDDFIASASIPMSCLRKGYRSVRLYDKSNTRSGAFDFASLLVEVKMEQTLTEV